VCWPWLICKLYLTTGSCDLMAGETFCHLLVYEQGF
jgi:hypothetical protein